MLITIIVILISVIAFLFFKDSSEMVTSKSGGYNYDRYVNVSEFNEQLQKGIQCKILMTAQIHNGGSSDNSWALYGKLYKDEKTYHDAFMIKAGEKDKLALTYSDRESPGVFDGLKYEFDMFKDIHGFRGTSENSEDVGLRYIFFQGHEFRLIEVSSMEGSFMTIYRGVCIDSI